MQKSLIMMSCAALALSACSEAGGGPDGDADSADYGSSVDAETTDTQAADNAAIPELADIPVTLPQLAYTYDYRWRMPADAIGPLQRRHAKLCEEQGPASCQILGMSKSGEDSDEITGVLQMAVASKQATAFGAMLEDEAAGADAEQISAEIASEELSRKLVDTQARLEARTELRDRLLDVLKTRRGTVRELVEAERSVAQVNEEIDQARSWLAQMKGRIAYSRVTVHYETGSPVTNDFLTPVAKAVGSLGSILGYLTAIIILLGSVVLPIGLLVWGLRTVNRKWIDAPEA